MSEFNWTEELLANVGPLAREYKFDWSTVANHLRVQASSVFNVSPDSDQLAFISPQSCRTAFATQSQVKVPPTSSIPTEALKDPAVAAEASTDEASSSMDGYVPVSQMNFDNMSVDEILAAVEQEEERLRKKKEDVFRRVLHSLTDGQSLSSQAEAVHDSATVAFYESKRIREEARQKAEARRRDHEERLRIDKEREQLRRRFEKDSEDAQGSNPVLDSEAKYREDGDFSYDWEQQAAKVNLEAIFGNNHSDIDDFLTELEEEFESQAMGKDTAPSTELDRLFKLLDDAAASNAPKKSTAAAGESTAAVPQEPHDSNFARFQEEVAALSLAFPPPPPPSGALSTKAQEKTARASAASSSDASDASATGASSALSYKSQPMEAKKAVADATNARSTVGAPAAGGRGIRSEYAAAESAAKTAAAATAEDDEDSDEDLFAASRAKMKSASAVASSKLQKPPTETKAIIPVLTAATRSKIAGALDAQETAAVSDTAPSDDGSDEEESSEAESATDSDDEVNATEAGADESATVSAVDSLAAEAETVANSVAETVPVATASPVKAARPLIEELPSTPSASASASATLPQETSTPTTTAASAAAAPAASGSLLSGSLLGAGASSRAGKAKGKVVITNTRSKHAAASSASTTDSGSTAAAAAVDAAETLPSPSKGETVAQSVAPADAPRSPAKPAESTSPAKATNAASAAAAVEPAAEAVPEEPLPAAPLHLPTSIPLDLLPQASVLPAFPWSCLAQKSTGMMIPALWMSTLTDRSSPGAHAGDASGPLDDTVDSSCELQDLVAVSIYLEDTAADAEAFVLLEWLLRQVGSSMTLVGFLRGQVEEERHARPTSHLTQAGLPPHASSSVYHLAVFRKQSEDVSVHYLQQVAQVTKLVEVLPHRAAVAAAAMAQAHPSSSSSTSRSAASATTRVYVSDLLALYEFYDMPERVMNQLIAAHRSHLSDALPLPRGVLPGQVHVAPVVFRPNTLHNGAAVSTLIQQAEAQGLRVAGVRLLHLTPRVLAEIKKTLNLELPMTTAGQLTSVLVVAFIGLHGEPVADLLRSILGPEDPTLARKTDPQSIRALFGGRSRDENVAFSLSYAKEKLWREVSYWFGPRLASQGYPVLLLPKTTTVELGLRVVQYHAVVSGDTAADRDGGSPSHMWLGDDVAKMQRAVMDTVVAAVEAHGRLQHLQSLALGDFASRMFRVKPSWVFKSEDAVGDIDTMHAAQCLLLRLETSASLSYLVSLWQRLASELTTIVAQSQRAGATGVTAYVATTTATPGSNAHDAVLVLPPVQPPQGTQYLAQQILTKLSVHDYRSHEDVGLSDTVVVTVPLHGGLATIATDQPVATATACRFLPLLYARLPPSSHVHLLGAATAADGSHVALALRGYQLIETLDDVVRDMQAQFQLVLTPVATQLAHLASAATATTHTTAAVAATAAAAAAATASMATIAVLRGRRALERILQSFPLHTLYLQPAVEDLRRLVPNSHQFIPDDLFTTQASLEQPHGDQSSHAQAKAIAHALFPPGVFTSLGVLVLPVQPLPTPPSSSSSSSSGASHHTQHQQETNHMLMTMRYHVAALSRLQKDEFTVLAVQATEALSLAAYERLCRENFETYVEEYRARGLGWDDVLARLRWSLLSSSPGDAPAAAAEAEVVLPPPPPPTAPARAERGATAADSIGPDDALTPSPPKPPAAPAKAPTRRVLPAPSTSRLPAALIVLVARKSALLKLRHCVGPALDDSVASEKYPRSLTALFASLFPGRLLSATGDLDASIHSPSSSAAAAVDRYPFVLTSLSCATADWLVKKYLPAHRDVFLTLQQQQLQQPSQSHAFGGGDDATDHDASWTRDLFQAAETLFGVDASFQSRLAAIASSTANATASAAVRANAPSRAVSVLLKQEAFAAPSTTVAASPVSLMDSVDSKTVDVAGVVVTSALIAHHGLDTIFDVLHREGLVVVNSVTTKLTMAMVKTLSEAAGMSSLTLKPSNQTMLTGPVVVLGLYGPIHAFVRLKSFQVHTTRSSLLASTGGNAASVSSNAAAASLWTLPSGESGVLASSSSRLARQLFGLCFDRVLFHAKECPFVVVEDVSEAA